MVYYWLMLEILCKGKYNFDNRQILLINFFVNKYVDKISRYFCQLEKLCIPLRVIKHKKGGEQV